MVEGFDDLLGVGGDTSRKKLPMSSFFLVSMLENTGIAHRFVELAVAAMIWNWLILLRVMLMTAFSKPCVVLQLGAFPATASRP